MSDTPMKPTPEQMQDRLIDEMMAASRHVDSPTAEQIQDRLINDGYATVPSMIGIRNVLDVQKILTEYRPAEAEGTELEENPFRGHARKVAYSLRLDATDIEHLEAAAARRGVRPTRLAREWLIERLARDAAGAGAAEGHGA